MALRDMKIDSIPQALFDDTLQLRIVDLSGNNLQCLPREIGVYVRSLKTLDVSNNKLDDDGMQWGSLKMLQELQVLKISKNNLTSIPDAIGSLSSLSTLDSSSNEISCVSKHIGNLNQLKDLDLSSNKLSQMPSDLPTSLKSLKLNHNSLHSFHLLKDNLKSLELLDISENIRLAKVSEDFFRRLPSLALLNMQGTSVDLKELKSYGGFEEYDERRRLRVDKKISFKVMQDGGNFSQGLEHEKYEQFK